MLLKCQILSVRNVELQVGSNVPLMDPLAPRCLVVVILFVSTPLLIDIVRNVATRAETDQMRIVSGRTDRDCFGCSSVNIAKMMCDPLKLVCIKLCFLRNFVQNDHVMRWLCLIRSLAIQKDAQRYCEI